MVKKAVKVWAFDCTAMVVLAVLFAFNYELFIVKNHFAPAGVNGMATMIQYKFGFSIGYFSLIVNIPLCLFAFFCIDRAFAIKTAVFSVVYSVAVLLLEFIDISRFQYDAQGVDTIYPVLIAGAVGGFVYGLAFRRNSSTGGADIIAKFVSKKDPSLNFFLDKFCDQCGDRRPFLFLFTPSRTPRVYCSMTLSRSAYACCIACFPASSATPL